MVRRVLVISLTIFALAGRVQADPVSTEERPIILTSDLRHRQLGREVDVLEDASGQLTIHDVKSGSARLRFRPGSSDVLSFGFTHSTYWIRARLENRSNENLWFLQVAFPLIDHIELFEEERLVSQTGTQFPFSTRDMEHRTFVYKIKPASTTYYLRVQNEDSMQIPLAVWSPEAFHSADHDEQMALGAYYGILIVMAAYNLFLFLSLRERGYFYYVIYITVFGFFLFSQYGFAYEYLWPNWTTLARKMNPVLAGALEASTLIFTRHFLNTRAHAPRLDQVITVLIYLACLASPLALFLNLTHSAVMVVCLGLAASKCALVAGSLSLRAGFRPARYYMTAFLLLIVGAVLYALKTFGAIPVTFVSQYGMQLGSALEVTLLSLGLADRMNIMRRQTETAQRQLLEEKSHSLERQTDLTRAYARMVPGEFLGILGRNSILEVKLGDSVQKTMTVLFSDIRSFTELSETMTPRENFDFLNSYLRRMNPIIQRNGGSIDKYIGDAIMALFPQSPEGAVRAAVEMQKALHEFNLHREERGFRPISIGIGIHTGNLMFGTIGGDERMEVTVISDAVNQASRMEGLTKAYGVGTIISETTFRELANPQDYSLRLLGSFSMKGKSNNVTLLEILDGLPAAEFELRKSTRSDFEHGVFSHLNGQLEEARSYFGKVLAVNPLDEAAKYYVSICK
ncbi:MAG TPA: 7TM diverse intracellular signaling domain-containing protein [Leptospiraceae bacterium]|nr:adenylate cyclase [Leptospirales bacterium]HMY44595.1 7TM diverse intracellular signaling domain-containing protein [Leptospiraceae bacterium]HMZ36505.1 7TM diverse intracellular signaling domain-containing protein [Leptospiraceae bacterium]HNJ32961.1 7TM diverse intracellular signaling domain-containing protein [Leptospiraceae bacterium]HNN76216.1 7TM diverse intracellular signaling domain-containing protein [Leptospiraceae bacterium]